MGIELATRLVVVSTVPRKGHFFANTPGDDGPSILCLSRWAQIPHPDAAGSVPTFAEHQYYIFDLPQVGDKIVGLIGPGSEPNKRFAVAWTTGSIWRSATQQYVVLHHTLSGSKAIWSGPGILELSYLFPTNTWEPGGTFWRSADGLSSLQVVTKPVNGDEPYSKGPKRDPRVPLSNLEWKFRGMGHQLLVG